jgi:hypothetical protein
VSVQPSVPPVSAVSTLAVIVSVAAPLPESHAPQSDPSSAPASESAPTSASIEDPGSETDSNTVPDYALTTRPRPDAFAPPPPSSGLYVRVNLLVLNTKGGEMRVVRARESYLRETLSFVVFYACYFVL